MLSDSTFRDIAGLMHGTIGLNLPPTKKALVASRLAPRIHRLGLEGYDAYLSLLHEERGDGELQVAIDLLTTNETYFFREPVHFEILRQHLGYMHPGSTKQFRHMNERPAILMLGGRIHDNQALIGKCGAKIAAEAGIRGSGRQ